MTREKMILSGLITFSAGMICSATLIGCAGMQQNVKTVKDSVQLADDACVLIRDIAPDNKAGQEICAREEELRPYIKLILGARARPVLDGSAPDTSKSK